MRMLSRRGALFCRMKIYLVSFFFFFQGAVFYGFTAHARMCILTENLLLPPLQSSLILIQSCFRLHIKHPPNMGRSSMIQKTSGLEGVLAVDA